MAQLDVRLTGVQMVVGLTSAGLATFFCGDLKCLLQSFSHFI